IRTVKGNCTSRQAQRRGKRKPIGYRRNNVLEQLFTAARNHSQCGHFENRHGGGVWRRCGLPCARGKTQPQGRRRSSGVIKQRNRVIQGAATVVYVYSQ